MDLFSKMMSGSSSGIQGGLQNLSGLANGDESQFSKLEAPSLRQFSGLQGNLSSRFSGMGSGARRSSGFQNTANAAGVDLAERLQGNRMNLQQSAIEQLLGLGTKLLGTTLHENAFIPKQKGFWKELLGNFSSGLGSTF